MTNEQIAALSTAIAVAVAKALQGSSAKPVTASQPASKAKPSKYVKPSASKAGLSSKEDRKLQFEIAAVKAAEKRGFGNIVPNKTILTFGKWDAQGLRPKAGEKAIKVPTARKGQFVPLFHITQVEKAA